MMAEPRNPVSTEPEQEEAHERTPLLDMVNIDAGYGMVQVLYDVSLHLDPGEYVCLIGPNGSGKTTVMRTIVGIVNPSRGRVVFRGEDITGEEPADVLDRGISYVPQEENVFPDLTVRENLMVGGYTYRGDRDRRKQHIYGIFPRVQDVLDQEAGSLSGGEQKMVAVARALMVDPEFLILDEPTAGLQPSLVSDVLDMVDRLNREEGITILIGTQVREAIPRTQRGYLLRAGEVYLAEETRQLIERNEIQELYFGG